MDGTPQTQSGHIRNVVIIWAICTVVLLLIAFFGLPRLAAYSLLPPVASDRASEIDQVLMVFTLLAIPVFVFVIVFIFYEGIVFRSKGRPMVDAPQVPTLFGLQITWVVASFVLVCFLLGYGLYNLGKIEAPETGNVLVVDVTGEQWMWDYSYPQYGNAGGTTLELPVNRPIEFDITSIDVQHSFWIPAFSVKEDAVPGQITKITNVTPTKMGNYVVRCAELCGLYHSYMNTPVKVVTAEDFSEWIAQQPAQSPSSTDVSHSLPAIALLGGETSVSERGE